MLNELFFSGYDNRPPKGAVRSFLKRKFKLEGGQEETDQRTKMAASEWENIRMLEETLQGLKKQKWAFTADFITQLHKKYLEYSEKYPDKKTEQIQKRIKELKKAIEEKQEEDNEGIQLDEFLKEENPELYRKLKREKEWLAKKENKEFIEYIKRKGETLLKTSQGRKEYLKIIEKKRPTWEGSPYEESFKMYIKKLKKEIAEQPDQEK